MQIRILVTGGTFDKQYDELTGRLFFRDTHLPEMLRLGRSRLDVTVETVMMVDSLDLDDAGREVIVGRARACAERAIVVTHGTDTMVQTARRPGGRGTDHESHRPDRRHGAIRVWQLGRPVQPGERTVVRTSAAARGLCGDERPAFSMERGRQEPGDGGVRADMKSPVHLESKLPSVGTTIFTVMSRLAAELGAINLSQGFPDFDCDPALVEAVAAHMRAGRNQYAPMPGRAGAARGDCRDVRRCSRPRLRSGQRSDGHLRGHRGDLRRGRSRPSTLETKPSSSSRATTLTCRRSAERRRPGRRPLTCPSYAVDWEAVRRAVTPRTRLILINSPHNPTGTVLGAADLDALAALVAETPILVDQR